MFIKLNRQEVASIGHTGRRSASAQASLGGVDELGE
jgi:hypothetical protein